MIEKFVAGIVGAPFGLEGFVKVKPLSGETTHLLKLKTVILRQNGLEKQYKILESTVSLPHVLMRFLGYNSPEEVKILSGAELLINRKEATPLEAGEYYIEDLKGLEVNTGDNIIGKIDSIIEGGGGFLVEIVLNNSEKKLVPFRKEFFPKIDIINGAVFLDNLWILE